MAADVAWVERVRSGRGAERGSIRMTVDATPRHATPRPARARRKMKEQRGQLRRRSDGAMGESGRGLRS